VQADIVQTIPADQTAAGGLVGQSQGAAGILQVTQAGNQLLALQVEQMGRLQALMAAQGRAQALEGARTAAAQAQAREQYRRFLQPAASDGASPVSMFHD
jgi:P-type conjugative transfer protein TrbJ